MCNLTSTYRVVPQFFNSNSFSPATLKIINKGRKIFFHRFKFYISHRPSWLLFVRARYECLISFPTALTLIQVISSRLLLSVMLALLLPLLSKFVALSVSIAPPATSIIPSKQKPKWNIQKTPSKWLWNCLFWWRC